MKDYRLTQMYMPFYASCIATSIGFLFFFLSFSSPYWLQSYARAHNSFLHMGIWSVCFDRFVHPQDYHANVLNGCYWIFDRFFFKIGIWQWLNPHWLIAVQVLVTIAFITQCCTLLVLILYYLLYGHPAAESTIAMSGQLFTGVLLTVSVLIFGIKCEDRMWMIRPDQNFLSWSFGFAILAALSSFIAAGFLYCVSYTDRAALEEVEKFEAAEHQYGYTSVLSGKGGSASMYTRSAYGGTQSLGGVVVKVPSSSGRPEQVLTLGSDLRPVDTGQGSASLFTPSLAQQSLYQNSPGVAAAAPQPDAGHPEWSPLPSPSESQVPSTYGSGGSRQPLYANEQVAPKHRITKPSSQSSGSPPSSAARTFSPLGQQEAEEDEGESELNQLTDESEQYSGNAPLHRTAIRKPKY
ncbi:unnamed protein product [Calicophoron daubneyi]|uniref:PMP-22/EMP/MP20/Claudin tight junction n=1 Tax=Calicophoron daubneyi TaxID=300641 RepID=A0AAV2TBG9_CALDB